MKRVFRNIHLYLALAAGLIIMNSSITGAIMVFEDDINFVLHKERYFVEPQASRLPLETIHGIAIKAVPKGKIVALKMYTDPRRSLEISFALPENTNAKRKPSIPSKEAGNTAAAKKKGEKASIIVFVNPYTGRILDVYNKRQSFFFTVERLHRWLLGGPASIGKVIVGLSTLSFLIITLTGIVLWWPKNKKILLQRLKFKKGGSFKRLNHDFHVVSGFYTSIFLLIIIVSGLIMAYTWANKGIFTLTKTSPESPQPPSSDYHPDLKSISYDHAMLALSSKIATVEYMILRAPKEPQDAFAIGVLPKKAMEFAVDTYYIDQYTGRLIGQFLFEDKNTGQLIRSYVKPIHTGSIYGMPTKLFNFILALLTFSFPITGVIMWLNRIRKKKRKSIKLAASIR